MNIDMTNLQIDDLKEEDLTRISWSGSATHIKNVAQQLKKVQRGEAEYLVLRLPDGTPVAKGLIDHLYSEDSSEIGQLAVHPDLQGRGLGTKLIAAAESRIFKWGHDWAVIGVEVENHRALKLYKRLGYNIFGQTEDSWTAEDSSGKEIIHYADLILLRKGRAE
jgi:ribosomal protein S18 acetylase RimI-like enzyme